MFVQFITELEPQPSNASSGSSNNKPVEEPSESKNDRTTENANPNPEGKTKLTSSLRKTFYYDFTSNYENHSSFPTSSYLPPGQKNETSSSSSTANDQQQPSVRQPNPTARVSFADMIGRLCTVIETKGGEDRQNMTTIARFSENFLKAQQTLQTALLQQPQQQQLQQQQEQQNSGKSTTETNQ